MKVAVRGDLLTEATESFFINLSNATGGATIGDSQGVATILNDDTNLSINDVVVNEGDAGTTTATFFVTLSHPSVQPVTVHYATGKNSATGNDYIGVNGTVRFEPGETSKTIAVLVKGDTIDELNETFFVNLSSASVGAKIVDSKGIATIVDDDTSLITINDVSVIEGDCGTRLLVFTVLLSNPNSQTVTVQYATANNTATSSSDYYKTSGTLTFAAGQTSRTISVRVKGDRHAELAESFFMNLTKPRNATLGRLQGLGVILNDD